MSLSNNVFLLVFLVELLEIEWSGDSSVSFMTVSRASTAHFFRSHGVLIYDVIMMQCKLCAMNRT